MRKSTNAWGWLAAGVLALGVNGFLHDEGANLVRRAADTVAARSEAVFALATGQADQFLTKARVVAARERAQRCPLDAAIAQMRSRMTERAPFVPLGSRTEMQESQMAWLDAQKVQMEAQMAQFQFDAADLKVPEVHVVCPRMRVKVPRPKLRIPAPGVHVRTERTGSI